MPSVTFTRIEQTGRKRVVNRTQVPMRCVLKQTEVENPIVIEFPYGPTDVRYQQLAPDYSEIMRPGNKPILVRSREPLRTVTFTATIADPFSGGKDDVERVLELLQELSTADVDCQFIYGLSALPYRVRVTKLDTSSVRRNFEGLLTRAQIAVQLTEIPPFNPFLGELSAATPVGTRGSSPDPRRAVPSTPEDEPEDPALKIIYGDGLPTKEGEVRYTEVGGYVYEHLEMPGDGAPPT